MAHQRVDRDHDLLGVEVAWIVRLQRHGLFAGVAPTGKQAIMEGITIFQIEGQKIAALWGAWDVFGLVQQ